MRKVIWAVAKIATVALVAAAFYVGGVISRPKDKPRMQPLTLEHDTDGGTLDITGTWTLVDQDPGFPNQSTSMHCRKTPMVCLEATVVLSEFGMLPMTINQLKIARWTDTQVIIAGTSSFCMSETYTVDLITKNISGVARPRPDRIDPLCEGRIERKMKMISGLPELLVGLRR